jgi:hypothetical protein
MVTDPVADAYAYEYNLNGGAWLTMTGVTTATDTWTLIGDAGDILRLRGRATKAGHAPRTVSFGPFTILEALRAPTVTSVTLSSAHPSGFAVVGSVVTATPDVDLGNPTGTGVWEWFLDDVTISGATVSTYTPVEGDEEGILTAEYTVTNSEGSDSAISTGWEVYAEPEIGEPGGWEDVDDDIQPGDALLLENGDFLLLEDGTSKLLLEA